MVYCDQETIRSLALCNRSFHNICMPMLYRMDSKSIIPRSVAWAISECNDDFISLCVLERAQQSHFDFQRRLPYDCFLGQSWLDTVPCQLNDLLYAMSFQCTQLLSAFQLAVLLGREKVISFLLSSGHHDKELIDSLVWLLVRCLSKQPAEILMSPEPEGSSRAYNASITSLRRVISSLVQFDEAGTTVTSPCDRTPLYFAPWFPMSTEETLDFLMEVGVNGEQQIDRSEPKLRTFAVVAKAFRPRCKLW